MEVKIKSDGQITWDFPPETKAWNPEEAKFIVIELHGKLNSRYKYPISPTDLIEKIIVRVEK